MRNCGQNGVRSHAAGAQRGWPNRAAARRGHLAGTAIHLELVLRPSCEDVPDVIQQFAGVEASALRSRHRGACLLSLQGRERFAEGRAACARCNRRTHLRAHRNAAADRVCGTYRFRWSMDDYKFQPDMDSDRIAMIPA